MLPGLPPEMYKLAKEIGLYSDYTKERRRPHSPPNKHRKKRDTKKIHKRRIIKTSRKKNRR